MKVFIAPRSPIREKGIGNVVDSRAVYRYVFKHETVTRKDGYSYKLPHIGAVKAYADDTAKAVVAAVLDDDGISTRALVWAKSVKEAIRG